MSQVERLAADETPEGNSLVRALSATTEVCALPDGWAGKFVTFYNNSTSIAYVNFGTTADMTLDETTDTVRGSDPFPLTLTAATPKLLVPAGGVRARIRVPADATHFAHKSAGTGKLYGVLSTGPGI